MRKTEIKEEKTETMEMQEMLGAMGSDGISTNVDLVLVIDVTRSMEPIRTMVEKAALSFHEQLSEYLAEAKRKVDALRIKVIWFRDFYADGDQAYGESKFFELPEESDAFHDFVTALEDKGGGDEPESGLEALSLAMRSDFVQEGEKKRHIICFFTDAPAHPLEDYDKLKTEAEANGCKVTSYPENMPKDLTEFYAEWSGESTEDGTSRLDQNDKRMILFAPCEYPYSDMEIDLENVIRKDITSGEGGEELDIRDVYDLIAQSFR